MGAAKRVAFAVGIVLSAAVLLFIWIATPLAQASDPNALWRVVHTLCVNDMRVRGAPAPCTRVDLGQRYAVLKDIRGETQLLLIPTDRVVGIESPSLLRRDAPNYWQDAWDAQPLFEARVGHAVPREDLALAVNSVYGRSQQQLHIHIDCVRPSVRDALAAHLDEIGPRWSTLLFVPAGRHYRAMRLDGATLGERDPFKLLAAQRDARADMGAETLAVVGVVSRTGHPGFVLLSDRADITTWDRGTAEDLMDHSCAVLRPDAPAH